MDSISNPEDVNATFKNVDYECKRVEGKCLCVLRAPQNNMDFVNVKCKLESEGYRLVTPDSVQFACGLIEFAKELKQPNISYFTGNSIVYISL